MLQIVRASDNTVLGTLDSVGVAPNPATMIAPRYGTGPDRTNHVRTLPSSLAGTTVYLRVSPRRYGTTPVGIACNKITSWMSLSTMFEYTPATKLRCTPEDVAWLQTRYFSELLAFTDSTMLATGDMPDLYVVTHDSAQTATYRQRYTTDVVQNGMALRVPKDSLTFAQEYWGTAVVTGAEGAVPNRLGSAVSIGRIVPNPAAGGAVQVFFAGRTASASAGTLELYTGDGRRVGVLWSGVPSEQPVSIPIERIGGGVYFLVLTAQGVRSDARRVVIER